MSKVYKAVVVSPTSGSEIVITESAKSVQELIKKLEKRNYVFKRIV